MVVSDPTSRPRLPIARGKKGMKGMPSSVSVMYSLCPSKTIQPTNPWRNGGVELHEDKEHNADVRIDNAEEHSDSVEYLIEDDAPCGCRAYFGSHLFF